MACGIERVSLWKQADCWALFKWGDSGNKICRIRSNLSLMAGLQWFEYFLESFSEFLKENVSLFLSPGAEFGKCGDNFMRMNVACPKELLYGGLEALKEGVRILKENRK